MKPKRRIQVRKNQNIRYAHLVTVFYMMQISGNIYGLDEQQFYFNRKHQNKPEVKPEKKKIIPQLIILFVWVIQLKNHFLSELKPQLIKKFGI